jgi:hypothetical protein
VLTVSSVTGARVRARRDTWQVRVDDIGALRRLVTASVGIDRIGGVDLRIDSWKAPVAGWWGAPGIPGVRGLAYSADGHGARVRIAFLEPCDAGVVLSAVLRVLAPAVTGAPALTWEPGADTAGLLAENVRDVSTDERDAHLRRADWLVVGSGDAHVEHAARVDTSAMIDPLVHRPVGRRSDVVGRSVDAADLGLAGDLTWSDVLALRDVSVITAGRTLSARQSAQVAACGVLIDANPGDDPLDRQVASVSTRRESLRDNSPVIGGWPSVSIVMPIHRPDHVAQAMDMVRRQTYPHLQLVVVNHGVPQLRIADHLAAWAGEWVMIDVPGEVTLGEAMVAGSARADGALIAKMDHDDFYGSEHIWDLVLARMYSGAQVVGKALDFIYLAARDTTVFRPTYRAEKYADFVAGGTLLMSRGDLAEVGGWRPVPRSVDRALLDQVLQAGGLVYRTHGLGYVYVRHAEGNTAQVRDEHFLTKTAAQYDGLLRHPALGTAETHA